MSGMTDDEKKIFDEVSKKDELADKIDRGGFGLSTSPDVPRNAFVAVSIYREQQLERVPQGLKMGDFMVHFLDELITIGGHRLLKTLVLNPQDYEEIAQILGLGAEKTTTLPGGDPLYGVEPDPDVIYCENPDVPVP